MLGGRILTITARGFPDARSATPDNDPHMTSSPNTEIDDPAPRPDHMLRDIALWTTAIAAVLSAMGAAQGLAGIGWIMTGTLAFLLAIFSWIWVASRTLHGFYQPR
jgi:hypothetical protein